MLAFQEENNFLYAFISTTSIDRICIVILPVLIVLHISIVKRPSSSYSVLQKCKLVCGYINIIYTVLKRNGLSMSVKTCSLISTGKITV